MQSQPAQVAPEPHDALSHWPTGSAQTQIWPLPQSASCVQPYSQAQSVAPPKLVSLSQWP
jgi:hypothetical protein